MPMPSTFYCMETEFGTSNNQLEADQRALQLAIEYSMLGLTSDDDNAPNSFDELRAKKSINMTECVQVPSSEHVAEIVGRQGCKIKALRAKTNTYIKTPVRGEEPVFVITGRKEDVFQAKREILSAAEHFSQIRAQRKNSTLNSGPSSPTGTGPGQTTIQVRVPYRVVGLVVGPKGATIKRIQQATNTYIVTPSRDKEPIFEVTGSLENVESARKEIETHIALRTGALLDDDVFQNVNGDSAVLGSQFSGFQATAPIFANNSGSRPASLARDLHRALSTDSFYLANQGGAGNKGTGISDYHALTSPFGSTSSTNGYFFSSDTTPSPTDELIITNHSHTNNNGNFTSSCSPPPPASPSIWGTNESNGNNVGSIGSGRPTTPSHATARRLASEPLLPSLAATTTAAATSSLSSFKASFQDPAIIGGSSMSSGDSTTTTTTYMNGDLAGGVVVASSRGGVLIGTRSPTNINADTTNNNNNHIENNNVGSAKKKECVICCKSEVVAAFVPCGHNFFCMECATRVKTENSSCPVCKQQVTQVLRIIS